MSSQQYFDQTVSEADMDWLLCILLNTDAEFRNWLSQTIFDQQTRHVGAWRSISSANGESDLIWIVKDGKSDRVMALIENKINAVAQERQFERYMERGAQYQEEGRISDFVTVLFSPEKYSSAESDSYQCRLTYESLRDWLCERQGQQSEYFADLLHRAVERSRAVPPPCPDVTAFRKRIWELGAAEFPQLNIPEPGEVRETWTIVQYDGFSITHKPLIRLGEVHVCYLDLALPDRGEDVDVLSDEHAEVLAQIGASVVRTRKSASFRLEVPLMSKCNFDDDRIRETLSTWAKMLDWWDAIGGNASL
jgi:hypothetical protein